VLADWTAEGEAEIVITPAIKLSIDRRGVMDVVHFEREVARFNPSVVNLHYGVHYCSVKDVAAVKLARKRLIVTIHAPHTEAIGTLIDRSQNQIRSVRLSSHFIESFLANSNPTGEGIAATGVPRRKIHVINPGVRVPELVDRTMARRMLDIPDGAFVISAVGGLVHYKGFVELAEAVGRLNAAGLATLLLIAGEGPDAEPVENAARKLGAHCRMLGRVNKAEPVFAASDLFVLPSRQEGFGLVYIEAAFQGVPSIGCRSGGTGDAIEDGVTGLLVEPGNVDQLTEAIRSLRLAPERLASMGSAARERANRGFTDEVMTDAYDRVLRG
jgi:glycosyltransferase involved in cell wall biosynthesis